ncbi:TRAP-type C4-dicarboxylate transport system, substrate-binding protein [Albimonas donghaensis]|uniref:TRAP-type C4-dicarboxylate transport system, substrate-binding protein n=1 Tax=Albimonas donghaensis TaxID=356660 RepID=A0A1H3BMH2_9RHOB|nr:TRAP transporter substrate-binding protein [Albimonas donghaensis]SDX43172.1 TRAP-type C4-dicarboxylate transport system, substrate-binding protein [Albimonas donghaensis]
MTLRLAVAGLFAGALALPAAAAEWDVAFPWGATEFHTVNGMAYARAVEEATGGEVKLTIHPGGALGVKANESLRAVEDGAVPMAEYGMFQNVGDVPILGIEAIPFLVKDYAQLKVMHSLVRPIWEAELEKRNQKPLYMAPWPSQNFFTKKEINTFEDFEGIKMRTYDANTATMVARLGMAALQMNNADIVPALATGKLDAVMTSGSTAAAQKYWEFLDHVYNTNHLWATNVLVVNLDYWSELTEEQRGIMESLAEKMEPEFWAISEAEHAKRMAQLQENGMTVQAPSPEILAKMREVTADMADDFVARVPEAGPIIEEFKARTAE